MSDIESQIVSEEDSISNMSSDEEGKQQFLQEENTQIRQSRRAAQDAQSKRESGGSQQEDKHSSDEDSEEEEARRRAAEEEEDYDDGADYGEAEGISETSSMWDGRSADLYDSDCEESKVQPSLIRCRLKLVPYEERAKTNSN